MTKKEFGARAKLYSARIGWMLLVIVWDIILFLLFLLATIVALPVVFVWGYIKTGWGDYGVNVYMNMWGDVFELPNKIEPRRNIHADIFPEE